MHGQQRILPLVLQRGLHVWVDMADARLVARCEGVPVPHECVRPHETSREVAGQRLQVQDYSAAPFHEDIVVVVLWLCYGGDLGICTVAKNLTTTT